MLQLKELSSALDEIEDDSRPNSKLLEIKKVLENPTLTDVFGDELEDISSSSDEEDENLKLTRKKYGKQNLIKTLQTDYQKNRLENVDRVDVAFLKSIFQRIHSGSDYTIEEVSKILDVYVDESNNRPYADAVEKIKVDLTSGKLSMDEFLKFTEKFMEQQYPIDIFYKRFFKRSPYERSVSVSPSMPNMPNIMDGETLSDDESKLERVRQRIEEKREDPKTIQVIGPVETEKRGKIALINDTMPIPRPRIPEVKPITDKIFFETMVDLTKQDCEFLYKKIPWVKDIVNHIYVHPIEGNFDDVVDFNKFIEHNKVKFYQPKEKYYMIQCHSHKVQEGNNLTIIKNNESYKIMVAIDTNTKGIVLQNEDMLKAEIDYIRVWNQNKNEQIKELRRNEPNEDMVMMAKFELSNALVDSITGNVPVEYKVINSDFINIVVNTILKNSNSGDSFVRLLANIIIFLRINLSFITSSVFIKRLREQIYLPGTLPFLTDADKLPEIFLSKNVPDDTRNFVLEKLEEERVRFTKNFFESLHIGSSMARKPVKPVLWNKPTQQIELPDLKSVCKNRAEITEENDEDIVFYTDLGEVYCFNIYRLYDLFKQDDIPINPYTMRPFSDKFIQMFLTRYASKPMVKKIENVQHIDLASRLEQLIEQELISLENNLIEVENPEFIERFKSSITPNINTKQRISKVQPQVEKLEDPEKCMQCKGSVGPEKIASMFRNKQVAFCGYDCFEKNRAFK